MHRTWWSRIACLRGLDFPRPRGNRTSCAPPPRPLRATTASTIAPSMLTLEPCAMCAGAMIHCADRLPRLRCSRSRGRSCRVCARSHQPPQTNHLMRGRSEAVDESAENVTASSANGANSPVTLSSRQRPNPLRLRRPLRRQLRITPARGNRQNRTPASPCSPAAPLCRLLPAALPATRPPGRQLHMLSCRQIRPKSQKQRSCRPKEVKHLHRIAEIEVENLVRGQHMHLREGPGSSR